MAYDLIIVGAGPAGLSAALSAYKNRLNYILLEKTDHIADTVYCYQKRKFVMAEPSRIPKHGELWMQEGLREDVLDHWKAAVDTAGLQIAYNAEVVEIRKENGSFTVKTHDNVFLARQVIIAIGTQGTLRQLGVPGEDLSHVLPRLDDPAQYTNKDIVVVGGGDAAIEVADALVAQNQVTMVVRTPEIVRAKARLEQQALDRHEAGQLTIHFGAMVERVDPDTIALRLPKSTLRVLAQVVIAKIGAILPRAFLEKSCGIAFSSAAPDATPVLSASYETSVPGLFLVGAVSGRGDLIKHAINQGYEVIEHLCGREVEPADEALLRKKLDFLPGTVSERIRALVAKAPLFAEAREEDLRELLLLFSEFHRLPAGHVVFYQNDPSESLYMIVEGSVQPLVKGDDGQERPIATRGPGEFFGEMSLISGRQRSATVRVATDAFLWEIERRAMLKFLHLTPAARQVMDDTFLIRAFQTYLLPDLDPADLAQLARKAKVLTCEKGSVIYKEGDPKDAFYFIRSGKVKVSTREHGREKPLAYREAGQYVGETALFSDEPRTATVSAVDRVEVIQIAKEDFQAFVGGGRYERLEKQLREEHERRVRETLELQLYPERVEAVQFAVGPELVVGDNVLLIDENLCVHCDNCVKACEGVHNDGQTRLKRTGLKFANILVANSCRHCDNPLCMTDCDAGDAIARDPRGEVYIRDNCVACGKCAANCPYDAIFMVHPKEKWPLFQWFMGWVSRSPSPPPKGTAVKCDLCRDLQGGPACVRSCPTGAVYRVTPEEYHEKIDPLVLERILEQGGGD